MKKKYTPYVAIVLDGFGISNKYEGNAVELAKKPNYNKLKKDFVYTELLAHGKYVGLMNNKTSGSEVGHVNIGAGRIIKQDAAIISEAIEDGSFYKNEAFIKVKDHVLKNKSTLHLMGLMSNDDSPHSNFKHFRALIKLAKENNISKLAIHLFTDGRDSSPKSAKDHLRRWGGVLEEFGIGKIASLTGRYFAMDRTKNWNRLIKAYNCMVKGEGEKASTPFNAIDNAYKKVDSDEYIEPTVIYEKQKPVSLIKNQDGIIFFNLRSDRARQLTKLFVLKNSTEFKPPKPGLENIKFVTLTGFGPKIKVLTAYNDSHIKPTLPGSINGLRQLYITETEKFSHVTYFLNGKQPSKINNEARIMIPSPEAKNYAETPKMSASIISDVVIRYIKDQTFDFIFINYCNPDMLGHTGDIKAAVEGISFVDKCLGKLYSEVSKHKGTMFIFSDHGNSEEMLDKKTGEKITFHTKNKIPFIITSKKIKKIEDGGVLSQIAPSMLKFMDQKTPKIMGKSLF